MSYTPIAYVDGYNGCMLCTDHGETYIDELHAEYGDDLGELEPTPVMEWDEPLPLLEWCDEHHTFCGNCGAGEEWIEKTERRWSTRYQCTNCRSETAILTRSRRTFERWGLVGDWIERDA